METTRSACAHLPTGIWHKASAKAGINSLRIDKRGMFGSARAIPDANKVSVGDYADDVHAWIKVAQD